MIKKQLLHGLSVLITRPEGQGQSLGEAISKLGGRPVFFPLLRITPVEDEKSLAQVRQRIQHLDSYDMAIFISSNAVKFGLEWIDQYWPQFPQGLKVFAIGPVTAATLKLALTTRIIRCPITAIIHRKLPAWPRSTSFMFRFSQNSCAN